MNLRRLETFYWAARLGSFTAAADRLNATQSTISMRIQELEREFGVALFDRSQRAARVTAAGRELLQYATQLLRIYAEMRDHIATSETITGVLRLGVAEVISLTWLPRLIQNVHQQYPKLRIELDEELTKELVDRLEQGSLDLILAPGQVPGYQFNVVPLGEVKFAWMASPSLGLSGRKIGARELQDYPIIALARESFHHRSIEDWFRASDAYCDRIDTCKSLTVAASLACSGLGVTLLPLRCYEKELNSGQLQIVDASPEFPPIEFNATCTTDGFERVARQIAELARDASDFDHIPAAAAAPKKLAAAQL